MKLACKILLLSHVPFKAVTATPTFTLSSSFKDSMASQTWCRSDMVSLHADMVSHSLRHSVSFIQIVIFNKVHE